MKFQLVTGACALALGACTSAPTPLPDVAAQQAVTLSAVSSTLIYRDPLSDHTLLVPTELRDWRDINQEQSEGN